MKVFELNEYDLNGKCCNEPHIEEHDGNYVCVACATVIGRQYIGEEVRAYTFEDIKNTKRTEVSWRSFGPRTVLCEKNKDSKGDLINAKDKVLYGRLAKIQKSLISSMERNLWEAKPKLKWITAELNIPKTIEELAWRLYKTTVKKKLTTGRSIDGFVVATLYIAIRVHGIPKLLEEIAEVAQTSRKNAYRSISLLIKEILPIFNLKYKPISIEELIFRFGTDLEFPLQIKKDAINIFREASMNGLEKMGKDPKGIAGATLYISNKRSKGKHTQLQISQIVRVTEVTLRSRIAEIKKLLK